MGATKVGGIALERRGTGEPLLLIHGTGGSRAHWRAVIEPLAAERELLLVDLPGHGESDPPPPGAAHTPIGYAAQLAAMLDELEVSSVHVAGNSVGGWTALELAKLGRARSVVALAPAGLWADRDPWRCRAELGGQYWLGRLFAPVVPTLMRNDTTRTLFLSGTVAKPKQVPADAAIDMAQTFAGTPSFRAHLHETSRARFQGGRHIEVPVTVAWGEKERLIPAKARLRDELPAGTRYVTLAGCGHLPMWDDPELVTRTILDDSLS
jgi:pimeloyl-ACP methyl ester carboxylesterase